MVSAETKELGHDVINNLALILGKLSQTIESDSLDEMKKYIMEAMNIAEDCKILCQETMIGDRKDDIPVQSLAQEIIETYQETFPEISIKTEINMVSQIKCSKILFKNAVKNIIKNSIEAKASNILIRFEKDRVSFIDNGRGINQMQAKLIVDFGTTKTNAHLHGIGVKSLHRFCKKNSWKFKLENNKADEKFKKGVTVSFLF